MERIPGSAGPGYRTIALAAALALSAAVSAAPDARAAEGGWYIGLNMPVMFVDDTETKDTGAQAPAPGLPQASYAAGANTEHKTGFKVAGLLGYELGGGLRFEGELFFARSKVEKLTYSGVTARGQPLPVKIDVPTSGGADQLGATLNVWFDFETGTDWVPFIGGGAGFVRVDQGGLKYNANAVAETIAAAGAAERARALDRNATEAEISTAVQQALAVLPPAPELSETDTALAYHFGVGVGYRLNDNTTLQLGYRLQAGGNLEFSGSNANGRIKSRTDLRVQFLELGFRTRF